MALNTMRVNIIRVALMPISVGMRERPKRLREARLRSGFSSAAKAADALGVTHSTYRAHENGQNDFDIEEARVYGRKFKCDPYWLLTGIERSSDEAGSPTINRMMEDFEKLGFEDQLSAIAEFSAIVARGSRSNSS